MMVLCQKRGWEKLGGRILGFGLRPLSCSGCRFCYLRKGLIRENSPAMVDVIIDHIIPTGGTRVNHRLTNLASRHELTTSYVPPKPSYNPEQPPPPGSPLGLSSSHCLSPNFSPVLPQIHHPFKIHQNIPRPPARGRAVALPRRPCRRRVALSADLMVCPRLLLLPTVASYLLLPLLPFP